MHLSGGEPLLRPDIETQVEKIVSAGIAATITTNGMLISKRRRLLKMPLKWIVTHHECNDFEKWRFNADLIKKRPHIACRLLYGAASPCSAPQLEPLYKGLNFMWSRLHGLRLTDWKPVFDDLSCIASDVIHLIEPSGHVYPCNNNSKSPIGNINTMEYDKRRAFKSNGGCAECIKGGMCGAYQTAVLSNGLNG